MLNSIEVRNFKSLTCVTVPVSRNRFNVSVGMNSIGKSSLIQAILMLCQGYGQDNVILNGRLTRLGLPSDVIRNGCSECEFGFGYDSNNGWRFHSGPKKKYYARLLLGASAEKSIRSDTLQPKHATIYEGAGTDYEHTLAILTSDVVAKDVELCKQAEQGKYSHCDFMRVQPRGQMEGQSRTYVAFNGIAPMAIIWLKSKREVFKARLEELENLLASQDYFTLSYCINGVLAELHPDERKNNPTIRPIEPENWPKLSEADVNRILQTTAQALSRAPYQIADVSRYRHGMLYYEPLYTMKPGAKTRQFERLIDALSALLHSITDFSRRVCYLGPLRDEPKVVSESWDEKTDNLPVGIKGERTASILLERYDDPCNYCTMGESNPKSRPLHEAIDDWASYVGISNKITVTNRQKLGVGITVGDSGKERDLTMVGVGVSQLTPVLTLVLSVPKGSFVMIEQPELHLHPAAQAKLADLLLFARPDLSFIIETHSEALVTRLRLRAAQEERARSRLSILFFENDDVEGGTLSRTLSIDEYGNLSDWPEGFFETTQEDLRELLLSSMGIQFGDSND